MSAEFNPYEAWLGIPRDQQPPSHYRLLGLRDFESEPPTIVEAADDQLARVQPHTAGSHSGNARTLLAEIQASRKTLLSRGDKQAYDAALQAYLQGEGPPPARAGAPQASGTRLPPAAPTAARVASVAAPAFAAPVAAVQPARAVVAVPVAAATAVHVQALPFADPPRAAVAVASEPGVAIASGSSASVASQTRIKNYRRRKSSSAALVLLGGAAVVLLAAVAFAMYATQSDKQVASKLTPPAPVGPVPTRRDYSDFNNGQPRGTAGSSPAVQRAEEETAIARSLGMEGNFAAPGTGYRSNSLLLDADEPAMPAFPGDETMPSDSTPSPATVTADLATLDLGDPSVDERKAVEASLKTARDAIAQREYAKAHEAIDLATLLAAHPETIDAVERLRAMLVAVDNFWASVRDAVGAIETGEKITAGADELEVLSKDAERLSVRRAGRTINYVIDRVPPELATTLAQRAFAADDAHGKLTIGAFLVSDARGDEAKGRQLLDEAGKQGADATLLLAEVDSRQPAEQ